MRRIVLLAVVCMSAAAASAAETIPEPLKTCMTIKRDAERLSCFDRALEALEAGDEVPAPSAENMFGVNPGAIPARAGGVEREELKQISGQVTSLSRTEGGMIVLTLDNGQVWRQQDSDASLTIDSGDSVTVTRGSLGTFRITDKRGRSARFKRVR